MSQELSNSLQSATGKLYAVKCDISKDSDTETTFKWIKDNLGGVDILVNNAAAGFFICHNDARSNKHQLPVMFVRI